MVNNYFQLNIVTAESEIYSGLTKKLFVTGILGELEILYNHAPLLTSLFPGPVWIENKDGKSQGVVIFGGILEVQPKISTILADSALRAENLDEASALLAKKNAENIMSKREDKIDYAKARIELAMAVAQLRLIRKLKK